MIINKPEVVLPTVPQAFFDEFGVNADDRVMDYGQACYDAGALSAAPQQSGLDAFSFVNRGDSEDNFVADGEHLNCPSCGGSGHVDDVQPQQPAEAVAWMLRSRGDGKVYWDSEVCVWGDASAANDCAEDMNDNIDDADFEAFPVFATPPPAIDIGKLRELVTRWRNLDTDFAAYKGCANELAALIGDGGRAQA